MTMTATVSTSVMPLDRVEPEKPSVPAWLSLLYVPGHRLDILRASLDCGAHAVIHDLEDFVPMASKADARRHIETAASLASGQGMGIVVRINRRMDLAVADLDHAIVGSVSAVMVPKVLGADHLHLLDEVVGTLEARRGLVAGSIRFIALVETAAALARIRDICEATPRTVAIGLGGEDIARECGMRAQTQTLRQPKQEMIFAAVAAGIIPLGYLSSVTDYQDEASFLGMVEESKSFGFQAATCLNADQVRIVNKIYAPSEAEIQSARVALDPGNWDREVVCGVLAPSEQRDRLARADLIVRRATVLGH